MTRASLFTRSTREEGPAAFEFSSFPSPGITLESSCGSDVDFSAVDAGSARLLKLDGMLWN